jgi:hypothetical protein
MTLEPTPLESVLGSGAGGPLTAPTPWATISGGLTYPGAVTIGSPSGGFQGPGSLNLQQIYVNGVLLNVTQYLQLTGGVMTGVLTLAIDPVNPLDAATKRYVDNSIVPVNGNFANYLPLAGGTLTGALTLKADPAVNLGAATKQYVDNKFTGLIAIPDAPNDGNTYGRKSAAWSNVYDRGTY